MKFIRKSRQLFELPLLVCVVAKTDVIPYEKLSHKEDGLKELITLKRNIGLLNCSAQSISSVIYVKNY